MDYEDCDYWSRHKRLGLRFGMKMGYFFARGKGPESGENKKGLYIFLQELR